MTNPKSYEHKPSQAQQEARIHNWSKAVVKASCCNLRQQLKIDKRLHKSVYKQEVELAVSMLQHVLNNWW
jgi:hypothetical protein